MLQNLKTYFHAPYISKEKNQNTGLKIVSFYQLAYHTCFSLNLFNLTQG